MYLPVTRTREVRSMTPRQKFEGHTERVNCVIHLPGGQRIMTCSHDRSLRLWNLENGEQVGDDWRDGERSVMTIALSPDGKRIVSGEMSGMVKLWDIDTAKVIIQWTGDLCPVTSLCWSQDCGRVLTGYHDGTARIWNVESREAILSIKTGFREGLEAIYSPDETMIATGGDSKEKEFIKIWDANSGKLVTNLEGHTWRVACLVWTGSMLVSGSHDSSIRTWNTTTWQQMSILTGHTGFVHRIAISPNHRILASASSDDTVRLWNLGNGQPIGSPLQHADPLCVSFSADGKLLATSCEDKNAYTWDVSAIIREAGLAELLNDRGKSSLNADATRRPGQRRENPHQPPPRFEEPLAQQHPASTLTTASAAETSSNPQPPQGSITQPFSRDTQVQSIAEPHAAVSVPFATPVVAAPSMTTLPLVMIRQPGRWSRFWRFIGCGTSAEYTEGPSRH